MVLERMKDVPPIDTSRDQMIKPSLDLDPRLPRHLIDDVISSELDGQSRIDKIAGPTTFLPYYLFTGSNPRLYAVTRYAG